MDIVQLNTIKASISKAQESGDTNRILDALAIGLVANMECNAKDSERQERMFKSIEEIKLVLKDVLGLDERVKRIEAWKISFEEQKKGASKMLKILLATGIFGGGALAGHLPQIIKGIVIALGN